MRLALLLPAAAVLCAALPVENWKYRRPLSGEAPLGTVTLDAAVFAGARPDLADLRVVREGRELPYVLTVRTASEQERLRRAEVLDRGVTARGLELTLDLGSSTRHNRVQLVTPQHNFRSNVVVETGATRGEWAVVRTGAAIFDFTQDGRQIAVTTIDYPLSTRRYLRVTIAGWTDPAHITGASVSCRESVQEARRVLAESRQPRLEQAERRTLVTFDLGADNLPVDRIDVDIDGGAFHRGVTVESSSDARTWSWCGADSLSRFSAGENLSLRIPETRRRYLRLTVHNGDDPPLSVRGARFLGLERVLTIEGAGPGTYLYYGHSQATAPDYDLARRLAGVPTVLGLGAEEPTPGYQAPPEPARPWSERNPVLLWSVLIAAICLIGLAVWRLLASMKTSAP